MPYDYAIDMWSIGCTLYELYTGKILFAGDSNNQMLKAIMEIRGKFTPKLYNRGQLSGMHFDDLGNFVSVEKDKALGKVCLVVSILSLVSRFSFAPCMTFHCILPVHSLARCNAKRKRCSIPRWHPVSWAGTGLLFLLPK